MEKRDIEEKVAEGPYHVKCLNGAVPILINRENLLNDCIHFRDRIRKKVIEFQNKSESQKNKTIRYTGQDIDDGFILENFYKGFMVGALQVHYYVENNGQFTKINLSNVISEEKYMAISCNLIKKTTLEKWLVTFSNLCPKGYKFVELSEKVKAFQTSLFSCESSPKFKVNTIFGQSFSQFYNDEVTHPLAYQKRYQEALDRYRRKGKPFTDQVDRACAARQLIVHLGDQVAQQRRALNKPIVPLVELCEVWSPSIDTDDPKIAQLPKYKRDERDRGWPTHTSACACEGCRFVIPYLITPCASIGDINKTYAKLISQFLRTKGS